MKENEAIEIINNFPKWNLDDQWLDEAEMCDLCETAIYALSEIQKYRSIGTIEECREARQKYTPKIPNTWGDGCDAEGRIIYDMYDCPNCGKSYEIEGEKYDHCPACGQAIDWSGLEESGGESDE